MAGLTAVVNAFTVDLEDWAHGLLGGDTAISDRVVRNVDRVLGMLDRFDVKATFFALGRVCERHPRLLPQIARLGHEVASHGYGHNKVFSMSPEQFRDDVQRSIDIIAAQIGAVPVGYRAPAFSITRRSLWAGRILSELGFKYSSSVFPFAGPRYGIADAPRFPYRWPDCELIEFPLTTLQWRNRRIPVSGGGYLRLLPPQFLCAAIRQANRHRQPAVIYMHPYELDPTEVIEHQRQGMPISHLTAFKQSLFRSFVQRRLAYLLDRFAFMPVKDLLGPLT